MLGGFAGVAPSSPPPLAGRERGAPITPSPSPLDFPAGAPAAVAHSRMPSQPSLPSDHATIAHNRRELRAQGQAQGALHSCHHRVRRRLIRAMTSSATRAAAASDAFSHVRPRTIVLITDPGPDPDDTIALLMATSLHLQERITLAAVICNGGGVHPVTGLKESRNRAALARCILDYFNLQDIPVGIGHQTSTDHRPLQHEYAFPGYAKVDDSRLLEAQALLSDTLRSVADRSLTIVVLSALSDLAALVARSSHLVASKVECISVMGGVELEADGAVRVLPAPIYLRPDHAANNLFDMPAAASLYSWCVASGVPLRVVSRAAVPNIPMRIVRAFASKHPYDPVMRYLKNASELGLVGLWRRICRGEVPNRDKRWFFLTFCGVSPAEFESLRADELGENFPIARRLDGTVKSYDVVALLLALHDPDDEGQQLFAFEQARVPMPVRGGGGQYYFFVQPTHLAPSNLVIEHLQLVYQFATSLGKWSVQARLQQARQVLGETAAALSHLVRQGHSGWVMCGTPCIVAGRECICSGSFDGTLRLWDVWTGACVKVVRQGSKGLPGAPPPPTEPVAAGAPGRTDAASGAAGGARGVGAFLRAIVGLGPARPKVVAPVPTPIASIAKAPSAPGSDAATFYYGLDNGAVQVWNAHDDGGETSVLVLRDEHHQHPSQVTALLLVDGDQSLLSAGGSDDNENNGGMNEILQWNLKFSIVVARYKGHTRWIRSLVASADGRNFYSCSNDGTICRWTVLPTSTRVSRAAAIIEPDLVIRPAVLPHLVVTDAKRNEWIRSLALTDDGLMLFSAGNDLTLRRWSTRTGEQEMLYLGHDHKLACVDVPRGPHPLFVFSGSNDGFIFQWSILRAVVLTKIECRTAITFIAISTDNLIRSPARREEGGREGRDAKAYEYRVRLFSGHYDTTVMMWETSVVVDEQTEPDCAHHDAEAIGLEHLGQHTSVDGRRRSRADMRSGDGRRSSLRLSDSRSASPPRTPAPRSPAHPAALMATVQVTRASQGSPFRQLSTPASPALSPAPLAVSNGGLSMPALGEAERKPPLSKHSSAPVLGSGPLQGGNGSEGQCKTMPRSSAVKFTHIPISSVLTAALDGPMVTVSAVLYALSHRTWDATGLSAFRSVSDAVMFGIENFVGDSSAFSTFLAIYWLMAALAVLSIVLFLSRAHERCVYALRSVPTTFRTDFENKGATVVVYKTTMGRALYYFERFLVYFIIMLGGAGFFMVSRYLLKVIECADGRWDVNPEVPCYSGLHVRYLTITGVLFPVYIFIACRMSASYNDVTYLSEVEGLFPSSSRKLRQLFTFWGSTVVKRAGWWTRHPVHGWKFGLTGRLCILINWLADLLIEQQDETSADWRWISVALWLCSAYVLIRFAFRYQPMAEPFSCKVLVVFRGLIVVTYAQLAAMNVLKLALVRAGRFATRAEFLDASRTYSLIVWAFVSLATVPLFWRAANRVQWEAGSITARQLQTIDDRRTAAGSEARKAYGRVGKVSRATWLLRRAPFESPQERRQTLKSPGGAPLRVAPHSSPADIGPGDGARSEEQAALPTDQHSSSSSSGMPIGPAAVPAARHLPIEPTRAALPARAKLPPLVRGSDSSCMPGGNGDEPAGGALGQSRRFVELAELAPGCRAPAAFAPGVNAPAEAPADAAARARPASASSEQ